MFAGFHYWYPIVTGVGLHPVWRKGQFWRMFIGVNFTFFPQHLLGISGMPRRYPDYPDTMHVFNLISSWGSIVSLVRLFSFLFILWERMLSQRCLAFPIVFDTELEWSSADFPVRFHNIRQRCYRHVSGFKKRCSAKRIVE
jgi:cytochrome c oxidase subunit 1